MKIIKRVLFLFLAAVFFSGCGEKEAVCELQEEDFVQENLSEEETGEINAAEQEKTVVCRVHICGAVQHPGVYEVSADSRVCDVIAAAGGLTEEADERSINQAASVTDGSQLIVYTKEEAAAGTAPGAAGSAAVSGKVNLNTADAETLMSLNGIGPAKAAAILAYRQENGVFQSVEELQQIEGIKGKTFEKIKDDVTIE